MCWPRTRQLASSSAPDCLYLLDCLVLKFLLQLIVAKISYTHLRSDLLLAPQLFTYYAFIGTSIALRWSLPLLTRNLNIKTGCPYFKPQFMTIMSVVALPSLKLWYATALNLRTPDRIFHVELPARAQFSPLNSYCHWSRKSSPRGAKHGTYCCIHLSTYSAKRLYSKSVWHSPCTLASKQSTESWSPPKQCNTRQYLPG